MLYELRLADYADRHGYYMLADVITNYCIAKHTKSNVRLASHDKDANKKKKTNFLSFDKKVVKEESFPDYVLKTELITWGDNDSKPMTMLSAYTHDGDYIGSEHEAKRLAKEGIKPESTYGKGQVCNIGFSESQQKWFGWSHRACKGFGIGDHATTCSPLHSTVSEEPIKTLEEAKQAAINFSDSVA